jgi:hypothetical protein
VLAGTHVSSFFDFADLSVDLVTRGFGEGIEEFLEALGLAEFAGEGGVDGHGEGKTLPRMGGMERICRWGAVTPLFLIFHGQL